MNRVQQVTRPIRQISGKKLQTFTVIITILVAFIVFLADFLWNSYRKMKMLDQYIHEVPVIVQDREEEMTTRSRVFEEDVLARGDLGIRIYREENGLSVEERLKKVCRTVSAESVSLTDETGAILNTTGSVIPADQFQTRVRTLELRTPVMELYPTSSEGEEGSRLTDGTAIVLLPVQGDPGRRLVFEFSCEPLLEIYNTIGNWYSVLERMLSGLDAYAFVKVGEEDPVGYPLNSFTQEEKTRLLEESAEIYGKSRQFLRLEEDTSYNLVSFQKRSALAVLHPYPHLDAQILLVVPLWDFMSTGVYCSLTLSLFIVLSMLLFSLYALKLCGQNHGRENREAFQNGDFGSARAGRWVILIAVSIFSVMLLMLESNATLAFIGTTKRAALQFEVGWHENQTKTIRDSYTDIYRTRTHALAEFLTDHREYRTHDALEELSDMLQAEYLMLFDEKGHEITASNSYTGFTVGGADSNLNDEYKAVLLGYPYAFVGPEIDPYTKKQQYGTAVLMTKENGESEGFVLAVFDAGDMNEELEKESLEHTVNSFSMAEGYAAAVINDEDGKFVAHTDPGMIGSQAVNYITEDAFGKNYEGFTTYNGRDVYVSGVSTAGKSLLFMVPSQADETLNLAALLMIGAVLLILRFLYCPKACRLCAGAMEEAIRNHAIDEEEMSDGSHPLYVFAFGYAVFLTLLAGVTLMAANTLDWPAFAFVFGGVWSKGVHLFSLWAVLFYVSVTTCVTLLVRMGLQGAERRAADRARTMFKLADSLAAYTAGVCIVIGILYMFGVNTTALLASAGVISIAVGMGAQDMAADIIAGLFIAIDDSIHMGDVVSVDSWKGHITNMGIRTIEITDDKQNVKIVNNSNVSNVVNMSRRKTSGVLELTVDRRVSMAETERILRNAVTEAMEEMPELYQSLKLDGIYNITEQNFTAQLSYSCAEAARKSLEKRLQEFLEKEIRQETDKAVESWNSALEQVSEETDRES